MNEVATAVAGFLALHVFFRALRTAWPVTYFQLDSTLEYALARNPWRYVGFRLGPVFLIALFVACTLQRYGDQPRLGVAALALLHIGVTSGRAIVNQIISLSTRGIIKWPVVVLAALVAVGSAGAAASALALRFRLAGFIPKTGDIAGNVWGGAAAAVGAVYIMRVAEGRSATVNEALESARIEIPRELWHKVSIMSKAASCDPFLLGAVMVLENAQRPAWFRRLERIKGRLLKQGTYGIMQIYSERPISDEISIEKMAQRLSVLSVPLADNDAERIQFFRQLAVELNGSPVYGNDLSSLYYLLEESACGPTPR